MRDAGGGQRPAPGGAPRRRGGARVSSPPPRVHVAQGSARRLPPGVLGERPSKANPPQLRPRGEACVRAGGFVTGDGFAGSEEVLGRTGHRALPRGSARASGPGLAACQRPRTHTHGRLSLLNATWGWPEHQRPRVGMAASPRPPSASSQVLPVRVLPRSCRSLCSAASLPPPGNSGGRGPPWGPRTISDSPRSTPDGPFPSCPRTGAHGADAQPLSTSARDTGRAAARFAGGETGSEPAGAGGGDGDGDGDSGGRALITVTRPPRVWSCSRQWPPRPHPRTPGPAGALGPHLWP